MKRSRIYCNCLYLTKATITKSHFHQHLPNGAFSALNLSRFMRKIYKLSSDIKISASNKIGASFFQLPWNVSCIVIAYFPIWISVFYRSNYYWAGQNEIDERKVWQYWNQPDNCQPVFLDFTGYPQNDGSHCIAMTAEGGMKNYPCNNNETATFHTMCEMTIRKTHCVMYLYHYTLFIS